jgi:predicted phosphodiesterase
MSNTDEYCLKISKLVQEVGIEETSKILGIKQESVTRRIREAKAKGIFKDAVTDVKSKYINKILENYSEAELRLISDAKSFVLEKSKKININFEGKSVKIGVITDTHIGHLKFFEERVYAAFEEFKKEKVDFICHAGDVTEGMSHRPGHIYELTHLGYEAQKKYAVKIFGQWTDTPIYAISGNHDQWYIKSNGANIVGDIDKELSNFNFLGHDEADILLNSNVTVRLWHGGDGSSYALSYRVQKILESLQGGDKPNVMFCGHTHKYVKLFERNVHAISAGCIEDQTSWMRGKRLSANPGFGIYEITFDENGVKKLNETFYPFY